MAVEERKTFAATLSARLALSLGTVGERHDFQGLGLSTFAVGDDAEAAALPPHFILYSQVCGSSWPTAASVKGDSSAVLARIFGKDGETPAECLN